MTYARTLLIAALWLIVPSWGKSAEPLLIDMTDVRHKPTEVTAKNNTKVPAGTVELVDGQFGKACKFSFVDSQGAQFFVASVNPKETWDQYEGFSFWVKGHRKKVNLSWYAAASAGSTPVDVPSFLMSKPIELLQYQAKEKTAK